MSGVTNRLIEAANSAQAGNAKEAASIMEALREQHELALRSLTANQQERSSVGMKVQEVLLDGRRLCDGTALLGELTPRTLDAISGLGERISALLVAVAVRELGLVSEAITATELIVTDSYHGGADEVIIWTDVDGVLTADPRLVPEAKTIPEISYREAAELAYFGAKVLHPKTLNPVVQAAIPVWIRNSFQPERPGTKITREGRSIGGGVKALTAIRDVTLISVGGPGIVGLPDVVGRTFSTTAEVRANVLLISQSSSQNDICFIVSTADAQRTVEAMRKEFAQDLAHQKVEHVTVDPNIAIVAVVGENMRGIPGVAGRTFSAMGRDGVNIIVISQGSSESNISFVIEEKDVKNALLSLHREFGLSNGTSRKS
jgi:aspartate kinase